MCENCLGLVLVDLLSFLRHPNYFLGNQLEGKLWPNRREEEYILKLTHSESYNKLKHMNLDEHSQASVVGNLIDEYCGASLYLNDRWKETQATRTLICRIQTGKKFLDMATLMKNEAPYFPTDEKEIKKLIKSSEATHVVVGFIYGYEAYCVIVKDLDDDEAYTQIEEEEKLSELAAQFVKGLEDDVDPADFKQQFDQEEIDQLNQIKCRLYADNQNRCVRKYGVFDVYKMWSKLTGNTEEFTVAAILCPIKVIVDLSNNFSDKLFDYYGDIDVGLIAQCYHSLSELRRISSRVNANRFISKKINRQSLRQFRVVVKKFQELLRKSLMNSILKARQTIDDDDVVERIVNIAESHPLFRPCQLERWLSDKQVECEMTEKLSNLTGITFLPSQKHLKKALADTFDKKFSLVLSIPPMDEQTNKILEAMRDYVETNTKLVAVDDDQMMAHSKIHCWYKVEHKRKLVVDEIRDLTDYVRKNEDAKSKIQYFITPGDCEQDFRCHYSVYECENLLKDNISQLPGPPINVRYQFDSTGNSICPSSVSGLLKWDYKDLGIPYHFIVQYRHKDSFWTDSWLKKTTKSSETEMAISLFYDKSTVVEFRVAAHTCIGLGEFSEIVDTQTISDGHEAYQHPDNESTIAEEMIDIPDDTPLIAKSTNNNDTIRNENTSGCSLLSLLGLIQVNSPDEQEIKKTDGILESNSGTTAEGVNLPLDEDTEIRNRLDDEDARESAVCQFNSNNYVNIVEEYYDTDEESDNEFDHCTI